MNTAVDLWAEALWEVMGLGFVIYAVTAGADFGAGLWSLLASGPRKKEQREKLQHAIAPIWEANHVWLIFVVVVLFAAFPPAFAALSVALHIPIALALVGIVLRGAAFTFNAYGIHASRTGERWSRVFAWSSIMTPLFLGSVVAAVSSGEVRVGPEGVTTGYLAGWTTPFAFVVGCFVVALFALLAACYLAAESSGALADDFRRRALVTEGIAGALAAVAFVMARSYAPLLFRGLAASGFTWPLQGCTFGAAAFTLYCLWQWRFTLARWSAAAQVGLVVLGWGLAMDQHFILPDVSLDMATTHPEVLRPITLALGVGFSITLPALYYLYRVFKLE